MKRLVKPIALAALLLVPVRAAHAISDALPQGSSWLDAKGSYNTTTDRIISISNDLITVTQWSGATGGYLHNLEVRRKGSGEVLFSTALAADWRQGGSHLGFYAIPAGGSAEATPHPGDILGRGGLYYWDWQRGQWIIWSKTRQVAGGGLSLPAGRPDFRMDAYRRQLRWKYVLRNGFSSWVEVEFEMREGVPALMMAVRPRMPDACDLSAVLRFPLSDVPKEREDLRSGEPKILPLRPKAAGGVPLYIYLAPGSFEGLSIEGTDDSTVRLTLKDPLESRGTDKEATLVVGIAGGPASQPAGAVKEAQAFGRQPRLELVPDGERHVFSRGEAISWSLDVRGDLAAQRLYLGLVHEGQTLVERSIPQVGPLAHLDFVLPTRYLAKGQYELRAAVGGAGGGELRSVRRFLLVPGADSGALTVQVFYFGPPAGLDVFQKLGSVVNRFRPFMVDVPRLLDYAPLQGSTIMAGVSWQGTGKEMAFNDPAYRSTAAASVRSAARLLAPYPAVVGLDIGTETRNEFREPDAATLERMRAELGLSAAPKREWKPGIVPDDDPYLRYARWWIGPGGMPGFIAHLSRAAQSADGRLRNTQSHGYMSASAVGLYAPTVWGDLDELFKWTYTIPDPKDIAFATDCLKSAARKDQAVCSNIQLLWKPGWVGRDEPYTINADILRESVWLAVTRGIDVLSFWPHTFFSEGFPKVDGREPKGCPEKLWEEMQRLNEELLTPYGRFCSLLEKAPDCRTALLYSLTEELATRWAHQNDVALLWHALSRAHVPADVIYEQDILAGRLEGYDAVVLPRLSYMRQGVADALKEFSERGGVVVSQVHLPFLPQAEMLESSGQADALGAALRARLVDTALVKPEADVSSPDVVVNVLARGPARYILLVNDRRKFGDWVGQFGKFKEAGVPQDVTVSVSDPAAFVYDLLDHRRVVLEPGGHFAAHLPPCGGRIFAVYPHEIGALSATVAPAAQTGSAVALRVEVRDGDGSPIPGAQPLRVTLEGPDGTRVVRYAATDDGVYEARFAMADNEPLGTWKVAVMEMSGGLEAAAQWEVTRGAPRTAFELPDTASRPREAE